MKQEPQFWILPDRGNLRAFLLAYCLSCSLGFAYFLCSALSYGLIPTFWEGHPAFNTACFFCALAVLIGSLGMAAFGIKPRWALGAAAAAFLLCLSHLFQDFDVHMVSVHRPFRALNLFLPILLALLASPASVLKQPLRDIWPLRAHRVRCWTIPLIKLTIVLFYFGNAVAKLRHGFNWMDGATLQSLAVENWLRSGNSWSLWLARHDFLCGALSVFTIVFELASLPLLFVRGGEKALFVMAVSFHVGVRVLASPNFLIPPFLGALLIFLL